ncbi:unnamed protein product [Jaminaea pallidilutea]
MAAPEYAQYSPNSKPDLEKSDSIAPTQSLAFQPVEPTVTRVTLLGEAAGTVQNTNSRGEQYLIPSPSDDPNDPLNWSQAYKWYVTWLLVAGVFLCQMAVGGPGVAMLDYIMQFRQPLQKTTYLFSVPSMCMGVSMLLWSPFISKLGRRPAMILGFVGTTIFMFASGACNTWDAQMACRILANIFCGAGELLGPLVIKDMFYVHERTLPIALYEAGLSIGTSLAFVWNGWISESPGGWRAIYWLTGGLSGLLSLVIIFTFPETTYHRGAVRQKTVSEKSQLNDTPVKTWRQKMPVYSGIHTKESWLMLVVRPVVLIAFPVVLWNAWVWGVLIASNIAVSTNMGASYGMVYHFGAGQTGSTLIGAALGAVVGIAGGFFADLVSNKRTAANGGRREPEFRVPVLLPVCFTLPLGLVLYGASIQYAWHWVVPTLGFALVNFSIVWGTSITTVYMIDCLKPFAEEVTTAVLVFKAILSLILSFYVTDWITAEGPLKAWGEFAAICAFFLLCGGIFVVWGKPLRQKPLQWRIMERIKWHESRDDAILEDEDEVPK